MWLSPLLPLLLLLAALPAALAATLELTPGSCPPPVALRRCSPTCHQDEECTGEQVCCDTVCGGTACVRAVTGVRGQRGGPTRGKLTLAQLE